MSGLPLAQAVDSLAELNDLKRITSAGRLGSIATRLFAASWSALVAGAPPADVMGVITGRALAAARLGDIDHTVLTESGVPREAVQSILRDAVHEVTGAVFAPLPSVIEAGLGQVLPEAAKVPGFVPALASQPRAGITCPGKPRILLEPPENHAEHCLLVAVYGVLLASRYEADPTVVFLAGLAHHFHNSGMADSGFTGEMLLGSHLATVMKHFNASCLRELPPGLRATVERARGVLPDADTPEGRAFHAADVLDRVLQLNQYMRASALTPERMLGEMELVHAGPVKGFQDDVLKQAALL